MSPPALRPRDMTPDPTPVLGDIVGHDRDGQPAVDLVHLARQTLGDRDLEVELLRLFAHQARDLMTLLDTAARGGGHLASWAGTPLHTLCGSARAVGCWRVAAEAESLERGLSAAAGAATTLRVAGLAAAVDHATSAIEHILGE